MKKLLILGNGFALGTTLFINYLSNTGVMNNTTIGEVSRDYSSLFTPAGYTFSIWGIIYLMLVAFSIFQGVQLIRNRSFFGVKEIGFWFIGSCLFNSLWVFAWTYEYMALSVAFIFALLFCLLKIVILLQPLRTIRPKGFYTFLYLPFTVYAGWVTVASIANVSSFLVKHAWNGFGIQPLYWAMVFIAIAIGINLLAIKRFSAYGFTLVGSWALVGIANANLDKEPQLVNFAFIGAGILLIFTILTPLVNRKKS